MGYLICIPWYCVLADVSCSHVQNVVHGVVKPENLLFTEDGTLKISDFGLAVVTAEDQCIETPCGTLVCCLHCLLYSYEIELYGSGGGKEKTLCRPACGYMERRCCVVRNDCWWPTV